MASAKRICSLLLRLIALGATLSATIVMATSRERRTLFSVYYEVEYTDIPAFKFFVIANAIVCVYSFLVLFLPWESPLWRLVVASDMVITMLLTSSISAALAIARVGKQGDYHAGWLPICGQLPKYCDQITGALVIGFVGLLTYVVLLLGAIHVVLNPLLLPID